MPSTLMSSLVSTEVKICVLSPCNAIEFNKNTLFCFVYMDHRYAIQHKCMPVGDMTWVSPSLQARLLAQVSRLSRPMTKENIHHPCLQHPAEFVQNLMTTDGIQEFLIYTSLYPDTYRYIHMYIYVYMCMFRTT